MSGVTLTYLAGAAVLCAAAAGCTFVARRMRREVSVVNKKVCSFPILFALLALLIGTCAVVFPASAQAAPTSTGSITVSGTVARSYDATRSLAPTSSTATATPRSPPTSLGKRRRARRRAARAAQRRHAQFPDHRAGSCRVAQHRFPPYERAERTARSFPSELWRRARGP